MTWYSACLVLLFLFRITLGCLDENDFFHSYGNFLKVTFIKLLDHGYVQSPFSAITRYIDNSILKNTLQFHILRTRINMRGKSFIKTSVNITETRIDEGAWKKISCLKTERALERTLHQSRKPLLDPPPPYTTFIKRGVELSKFLKKEGGFRFFP